MLERIRCLLPDLPDVLRPAVAALLEPIARAAGEGEASIDPAVAPAFAFDPVAAMGTAPRPFTLPSPPPPAPPSPARGEDLCWLGAADLAELVRRREVAAAEVVDAFARRAERLGPRLNAFITLTLERARQEARALDAGSAPTGRLSGVPLAVKDIVEVAGVLTTAGSRLMAEHLSQRDAAAWARLRAEGAILLGKAHTHEFAAGATGESEAFGPARNPYDPGRHTGGSSSGSAAAVAAALAAAALGTDTGGSIRIPAALCGVVGLKPTYGRVDAAGVVPLSWSLDHVGPLARTVRDAALLLDALAPGACEAAARAGAGRDLRGVRLAVPADWIEEGVQAGVGRAFEASLAVLRQLGAEVVESAMPAPAPVLMAVNRAIALPEGAAWHAPFLRAGRGAEYGANVRPRKEAGRAVTAVEYLAAQRLRAVYARAFAPLWQEFDAIVLPTVPVEAPPIGAPTVCVGEGREVPVQAALLGWTGPFNVLGAPAVSVPCGRTPGGLPVGLQLVAAPGEDARLCYLAAAFETASPGRDLRPPVV
ncbi:MAG: amidase [Firmicutes bacterium]|nr:amidase [Bacillota bacterium]